MYEIGLQRIHVKSIKMRKPKYSAQLAISRDKLQRILTVIESAHRRLLDA